MWRSFCIFCFICLFLLCIQGWKNKSVIKIGIIEDEALTNKGPALLAANKSNLTIFPLNAELVEYDLERKTKRKLLFENTNNFNLIDMQYITSNRKIGILTIDSMYISSFDNAHSLKKTIESIRSFACHPSEKKIFFGTRHGQIGYFEFEKDEIFLFPGRHQGCVWSVCLFPCGKKMATGSSDGIIQMWSLEKKEKFSEIKTGLAVNNICIDPEGKLMAVGFDCGHIGFWCLDTQKREKIIWPHRGIVKYISFLPENKFLSIGLDKKINIYNCGLETQGYCVIPKGHIYRSLAIPNLNKIIVSFYTGEIIIYSYQIGNR